jgi:hypothetical protein
LAYYLDKTTLLYNYIQIYHVWEGYLRKIPVARRKISRSEWRGKFSLKTGIFGRGICEKLKFLLRLQRRVRRWTPCLLSVESREAHVGISLGFPCERWTLLWDLTISGWPNEWINITWQCFIKSDSRYLYEYIIFGFIAPKHFRIIWFSNLSRLSVSDEGFCRSLFVLLVIVLSVLQFTDSDYPFGTFKHFLFQKRVLRTKLDIYILLYGVVIINWLIHMKYQRFTLMTDMFPIWMYVSLSDCGNYPAGTRRHFNVKNNVGPCFNVEMAFGMPTG